MRTTAVIAVALTTVLLSVSSANAAAAPLTNTNHSDTVTKLLLADAGDQSNTGTPKQTDAKPAEPAPEPAAPAPVVVTVQPGDSLTTIAAANNTSWVRLYDANTNITDPNIINPNDQIRIPAADEQLATRALPQPVVVTSTVTTTKTSSYHTAAPAVSYPTDPNAAKAFIYAHESGNNPNSTNPNGCYGLGQDCNGRVRAQCGADYACQDAFFTNYAMSRYGSWENALSFWLAHHWW